MWSRSLAAVILCLCLSCRNQCPADIRDTSAKRLDKAFREWKGSLDYMDGQVISEAYDSLRASAYAVAVCFPVDSAAFVMMDSVNRIYAAPEPDSRQISAAEAMVKELEGKFTTTGK